MNKKDSKRFEKRLLEERERLLKNMAQLENRVLKWTGILDFTSDEKTFFYRYKRILEENGHVIKEKEWAEDIPRIW